MSDEPEQDRLFADMRCANCGHHPESHEERHGQCYQCPVERRCVRWMPLSEKASSANPPWPPTRVI